MHLLSTLSFNKYVVINYYRPDMRKYLPVFGINHKNKKYSVLLLATVYFLNYSMKLVLWHDALG